MDASKPPAPAAKKPEAAPSRVRDRLEAVAKQKPEGGRAKTLVYLAIGLAAVIVVMLQLLGIIENPVAKKVRESKEQRGEIPKTGPAAPGSETPKPPETAPPR